ncbi:hypothetical protein GLOIN_2v1692977 [Rhizophagus irregularis DAOM 181602=DAOM 197198]|uniref:Uncharacterized protein n=2 Tax=Rhizophagus irregularis TaxID=588596 RepID=A0A2N1NFG9_9GLOM|nr:hypothetical protein GLOIN_2v1692977 [Rhizophagus irregularis DAOM 181602=DAOM 197198]PKK72623.1 hypothetical protein RhiirC2_374678 [Rhizophagus irregularis]POG62801.1 hypothetical protein GLOIN_2v1692977 [Rhizophagus irregularis DAOM 181602=DAOM 197198]|eukprot:XP_025169667.1 hypothetical protein GLOIN_2v1692977 [Rhizophagus irregularis DAOM 181602=DAOM 197198]
MIRRPFSFTILFILYFASITLLTDNPLLTLFYAIFIRFFFFWLGNNLVEHEAFTVLYSCISTGVTCFIVLAFPSFSSFSPFSFVASSLSFISFNALPHISSCILLPTPQSPSASQDRPCILRLIFSFIK